MAEVPNGNTTIYDDGARRGRHSEVGPLYIPLTLNSCHSARGLTIVAISTTALKSQDSCWVWRFPTMKSQLEEQQSLSELSMTDARHDFSQ